MPAIIQTGETTTARRVVEFTLRASDGSALSGEAGNVTVRVLKDGTSSAGTGSVTEPDATNLAGLYLYTMSAGEVASAGAGVIRPSLAGAVTADWPYIVVDYDPFAAPETAQDVAVATVAEMDANSTALATIDTVVDGIATDVTANGTQIDAVLTALNLTVISQSTVTTGGASGATSITLPTGLALKEGDILFFLTSRASAVVDTYTTGTGVTTLQSPGLNAAVSNGESYLATQSPASSTVDDIWSATTRTLSTTGNEAVADAVLDEALSAHTAAGSAGERLGRIPNAAAGANGGLPTVDANARVSANLTAISGDSVAADNLELDYDGTGFNKNNSTIGTVSSLGATAQAQVNTQVDTALVDADVVNGTEFGTAVTDIQGDIAALPTAVENADSLLGRNVAGGSDGGRTVAQALAALRNRVVITDNGDGTGTLTVYNTDDTTTLWSGAVSIQARNAIASVDPS